MSGKHRAYIQYRLERSAATLDEAKVLAKAGYARGTVNRIYYACFYAVSALLLTEGQSSHKHTGVRALFQKGWVRPRRVPTELGEFYGRMLDYRHDADYEDGVDFPEPKVRGWLTDAEQFVSCIAGLVQEHLAAEGAEA